MDPVTLKPQTKPKACEPLVRPPPAVKGTAAQLDLSQIRQWPEGPAAELLGLGFRA